MKDVQIMMQTEGRNLNEAMYSRLGKAIFLQNKLVARDSSPLRPPANRHPRNISEKFALSVTLVFFLL